MAVRFFALLLWLGLAPLLSAAPTSPWGGRPAIGKTRIAVCSACHGLDGLATAPIYPSLAGQHETYIVEQLQSFQRGHRPNPIMLAMSQGLSAQDMHDIGAYFAALPGPTPAAATPAPADLAAGAKLYQGGDPGHQIPACMACHGPAGEGNPGPGYPRLRGQGSAYLAARLQAWQQRMPPPEHPQADIMPTIARQLRADQIQALADYLQAMASPARP